MLSLLHRIFPHSISETSLFAKTSFKIAVAATLSFILAEWSQLEYPFYAVIAAVIVMSSTSGSTLKLGIQRIIGTFIGVIIGILFTISCGANPYSLGASIFTAMFFCSYWKLNEAAKLAAYVSAIVLLNHDRSPWLYALERFLETFIGIGIALLVNQWLMPSHAAQELRRYLSKALIKLEQFYQLVMNCYQTGTYDRTVANEYKIEIIDLLLKIRELWKEVKQAHQNELLHIDPAWEFLLRRVWEHVLTMEHIVLVRQPHPIWQELTLSMQQLACESSAIFHNLAKAVKIHQTDVSVIALESVLTETTDNLQQLQIIREMTSTTDELLRFFTFFYTVEEVGRKLQRMVDTL
ncbi:FUSC family protein [Pseudanabaena sp. UWO310]|uniref:FUSC family protein n=1 Tax=Pseudanabaena sp. UWO310 TaxID=2480795 RepID=UPI001159B3FF|nr:aromatic acid exporter family protein [Pseudanabaena sp. UWO310]TYQ30335.1 DUF2955 domain-containing protein [Pseudanabaena sp. UWO310]